MTNLRQITVSRLEAFLKDEWPYSPTYFGHIAVGNAHLVPRLNRGLDIGIDTADKILAFIELYRLNPETAIESAKAELVARRAAKKKAVGRPRKAGQARRVGAAA